MVLSSVVWLGVTACCGASILGRGLRGGCVTETRQPPTRPKAPPCACVCVCLQLPKHHQSDRHQTTTNNFWESARMPCEKASKVQKAGSPKPDLEIIRRRWGARDTETKRRIMVMRGCRSSGIEADVARGSPTLRCGASVEEERVRAK